MGLLQRVLKELSVHKPVLVSPSMSGRYSIPFLLAHGAELKGFVPIAPVGTKDHSAQQYQEVQVGSGAVLREEMEPLLAMAGSLLVCGLVDGDVLPGNKARLSAGLSQVSTLSTSGILG